jgi:hemerythrin-like domain-containing protein
MPKTKAKNKVEGIQDLTIVDFVLIDHRFLKKCIETFIDDSADRKIKYRLARPFLDAIRVHSLAEKKIIYSKLESHPELHFHILEAEVEHGILDQKVRSLRSRMVHVRSLKDELVVELKILSELLQGHIGEEENTILPKMNLEVDDETLRTMGLEFMKYRKFSAEDLKDYPEVQDKLVQWKDAVQKVSSEYLAKDRFVENMQH